MGAAQEPSSVVVPLTKLAGGSFDLVQRDWLGRSTPCAMQPPPSPRAQGKDGAEKKSSHGCRKQTCGCQRERGKCYLVANTRQEFYPELPPVLHESSPVVQTLSK